MPGFQQGVTGRWFVVCFHVVPNCSTPPEKKLSCGKRAAQTENSVARLELQYKKMTLKNICSMVTKNCIKNEQFLMEKSGKSCFLV